jgi:hypothetical protein
MSVDPIFKGIVPEKEIDIFEEPDLESSQLKGEG